MKASSPQALLSRMTRQEEKCVILFEVQLSKPLWNIANEFQREISFLFLACPEFLLLSPPSKLHFPFSLRGWYILKHTNLCTYAFIHSLKLGYHIHYLFGYHISGTRNSGPKGEKTGMRSLLLQREEMITSLIISSVNVITNWESCSEGKTWLG